MSNFWQRITKNGRGERNLALLGFLAIVLALVSTVISISIYQTGGAIQLDLSRPGYEPEDAGDDQIESWSATGELKDSDIDQFLQIWDAENVKIKSDAFRASSLSDQSLGIEK